MQNGQLYLRVHWEPATDVVGGGVLPTNDYGSPSSSISRLDDQTNNDSSKRANQVSQSSRSIESTDSEVIQSFTKSTDSNSKRLQRENFSEMEREIWATGTTRCLNPDWRSYVSKPILRRGDDGLSYRWTELKPSEIQ